MHYVKSVRIRRFSGPYFPVFGLNTERYSYLSEFSTNAGKYGSENSEYGYFSRSNALNTELLSPKNSLKNITNVWYDKHLIKILCLFLDCWG